MGVHIYARGRKCTIGTTYGAPYVQHKCSILSELGPIYAVCDSCLVPLMWVDDDIDVNTAFNYYQIVNLDNHYMEDFDTCS